MIIVTAEVNAKQGKMEELSALTKVVSEKTRVEEGCISYRAFVSIEDPNKMIFVEEWESKALLQKHLNAPHLAEYNEKNKDLVAGSKLRLFEAEETNL